LSDWFHWKASSAWPFTNPGCGTNRADDEAGGWGPGTDLLPEMGRAGAVCQRWRCGLFDLARQARYDWTRASKPGDRCSALAPAPVRKDSDAGWQGWGRGKSELRRAVCSLTARVGGGCSRGPYASDTESATENIPPKFSPGRPGLGTGKGEKVRPARRGSKQERTAQAAMPEAG